MAGTYSQINSVYNLDKESQNESFGQKGHHKMTTFREEYLVFLKKTKLNTMKNI